MGLRRLGRILAVALKAIIACHCQRAAPTLTTIFEIAALTAPLLRTASDAPITGTPSSDLLDSTNGTSSSTPDAPAQPSAAAASQYSGRRAQHGQHQAGQLLQPPLGLLQGVVLLGLRLARGWAPAVVVAQGVRLVGSIVAKREHPAEEARQEGTEVRALQLGLSAVPRVDPRVPRSLEQYTTIYREWLLLLRGRLAQSAIELPEGLFEAHQEGDEELMRFALCYNLLQARSLKDALVAMDRTISNIREFAAWYSKYAFIAPVDLEAWQRISWWEGPDSDGHLWLMIDFRAAVEASRSHGPELVARVLVSNMEYGVRQLIPELDCAPTLRVVVDASGVHIAAALKTRGVFQRVGHVIDRMYPCRLHVLYLVGLPFPLRWAFRACMQLLHMHTRRKIRLCRATDVPRRLPSQLRSHKLSLGAGLDAWAYVETQSYYGDVTLDGGPGGYFADPAVAGLDGGTGVVGAGSVVGSDLGLDTGPFTPRTPHGPPGAFGKGRGPGPLRRFRWRRVRGSRDAGAGAVGAGSSRQRLRLRLIRHGTVVLCGVVLLLLVYLLLLQRLLPGVRTAEPLSQRLLAVLHAYLP